MNYNIAVEKEVVVKETEIKSVSLVEFIGYKLLTAREAQKLTIAQVAKVIDNEISTSHIKNMEKGLSSVRVRDVEILCDAYEIDILSMFGGAEKADQ